ncbi:5,10-methylenetetrahydromethanopterin reductase [Halomicrobium mukohataei]|uniref:5,10-methylenetetrahydromethanopterin reductase n=1 Tax=Halomicrobium mukohataei TaxID=57705 RepID=A0A847U7S0_9EURY|nr:5,10-methylenetetrahydromethanopterin reductase [Halomicrobium mukohataei]NLV08626.1 5,10-methylenetetrahydromethanopterin reductase [Halomicrobium mukohataei]
MYAIELTPEQPVETLTELAVEAEQEGFDAVLASHHYNNRDQFVALSSMAQATDELLVGPGIANPYETHPVTLASRVATLSEVSGGRALFGVGPGDEATLSNLGFDHDRPLRRVLETFKVAQRLWDGERVDHDGTFQAHDAGLNYDVGEIPVYVGAQGPHMTRMAAKHADGALYNGAHPRDLEWASEQVAKGAADRPDTRGEFDLAAYASVSVAEDGSAAREAARIPVAFIAAGSPPPVFERHGLDAERAREVGDAIAAGEFRAAGDAVSEAMIDAFCIAGTPETVAERTDALLDYADSVVFASPLGPELETAISLLGSAARSTRLV